MVRVTPRAVVDTGGTPIANAKVMAAVFALILLPAIAATGFMFKVVQGDLSFATAIAGITFFMLAGGVFLGVLRMSRTWDADEAHQ